MRGGAAAFARAGIWIAIVAAATAILPLLAGCRSNDGGQTRAARPVAVSAAASLKEAFTEYSEQFDAADVRLSFAGSDELAAQIERGVRPDVYAAANTRLPARMHSQGLLEKPVVFATNRLVIAVPAGSTAVKALNDLAKPGVKIAAGSPSVPVGAYTRKLLAELDADRRDAILANIRSNEPDVAGVVGKLTQGAVDAGFVYATDVRGADGELTALQLPEGLDPQVAYAVAVVKDGKNPAAARQFVDGLLAGPGQQALRRAGFGPPPR